MTSEASEETAPSDRAAPDPSLVVLVHGAWHGGWRWAGVQAELDRRSVASLAVDLPGHGASAARLTGLHGDAQALGATLDMLRDRGVGPSSFERRDVDLSAAMVPTEDGGATVLDPATAPAALYGESSPQAVAAAVPRLSPQPMATMTEAVDGAVSTGRSAASSAAR